MSLPNPPCEGCPGLCCRNLDLSQDMLAALPASVAEAFRQFPYEIKNGTCTKLGVDGRCTVYEERPVICNYTASWMAFGEDLPFDDEASFRIWNISQCRRLQREHEHGQQPTE